MRTRHPVLDYVAGRDLGERTAALAAAMAVGSSFAPGLLPRGPVDQAVATGMSAALSYGTALTSQSLIEGVARRVVPHRDETSVRRRLLLMAGANLAAVGVGAGVARLFGQRRPEPVKRAVVRTWGGQVATSGLIGLSVTGAVALAELADRRGGVGSKLAAIPALFLLASGASAVEISWYRRHQPDPPPVVASLGEGLLVMGGVSALAQGEVRLARAVAGVVRKHVPGLALLAEPIGHSIGLGLLAAGIGGGLEYLYRLTEHGGSAIEAAYSARPVSDFVSGGPRSSVDWQTLGREGRRFVNMALSVDDIEQVKGRPVEQPIRVFVGLDSAPTVDARAALCLQEMERLGAFSRSVICLVSPTGTGYINYAMAETLEYLTGGDCAIVAMQYSLRPSFLSLDRVAVGREQNRALLHALSGRLLGIEPGSRPKLVGFGESLGAFTLQDAFLHEGTAGFRRAGMERALFIGTPAESKWAEQWRQDPAKWDPEGRVVEIASYGEWAALDEQERERARYFLLSHHEDPITKFTPALAVQAPPWLTDGPKRDPAVAEGVKWHPLTTFILTAVDLKNASRVVPGKFVALGHDYRADLARFTALAFGLPADDQFIARIEAALRLRELHWAEERLVASQLAAAREAVARQLRSWGAEGEVVDTDGEGPLTALASLSSGELKLVGASGPARP